MWPGPGAALPQSWKPKHQKRVDVQPPCPAMALGVEFAAKMSSPPDLNSRSAGRFVLQSRSASELTPSRSATSFAGLVPDLLRGRRLWEDAEMRVAAGLKIVPVE